MALTTAFLNTCRAKIARLPELLAFNAAGALSDSATSAARAAQWTALYAQPLTGVSPAQSLRTAVLNTVNAQADIAGTLGPLDRQAAYATLAAETAPPIPRPSAEGTLL